MQKQDTRQSLVIGPLGNEMTLADLPPPNTKRWVARRKAEVVSAVRGGLLSIDDACARYGLSVDEFLSWTKAIDDFGMQACAPTRLQQYRARLA